MKRRVCDEANPHSNHGEDVQGKDEASCSHVHSEDLNQTVNDSPYNEAPSEPGLHWVYHVKADAQQARGVEEQRPLELVREICAHVLLEARPRVCAIRRQANTPRSRCARKGKETVEQGG